MNRITSQNAGLSSVRVTLRRLIIISCLLALAAFQTSSFAASRIANLSTRANVGYGASNVILGTIVVGSGSATVVFRGIGPSLGGFPAGATLADPYLQIVNSNGTTLGTNNNWQEDPNAGAIQAVGLAPTNGYESALWIGLGPGVYSAVLTGVGGGTGIGVVEVYDITSQPNSIRLANVSTRANAGTGNNQEIFGIIIQGGNKSLGLRGIGPSLAPYFPGQPVVANPALSLNSGGYLWQYNQNWKDSQQIIISAYGLAPSQDLEAAMITSNLNGSYTVVMDTSGVSGIASIEAYDLGELVASGGASGTIYCAQYPNSRIAESGSFNLPAGTPLTLRFGGHASHASQGCPQCYQQGGPGCGGPPWSIDAVLVDNNNNEIGGFNGAVGGFDQCNIHSATVNGSIPYGFTPPYRLRLRATAGAFCPGGTGIYVDYYILNGP